MFNLLLAHWTNSAAPDTSARVEKNITLAQVKDGQEVTITGFGNLSAAHKQHLQAYGLLPGRSIRVLAQRPVTIVMVEQTELAFETEIARQVLVE